MTKNEKDLMLDTIVKNLLFFGEKPKLKYKNPYKELENICKSK